MSGGPSDDEPTALGWPVQRIEPCSPLCWVTSWPETWPRAGDDLAGDNLRIQIDRDETSLYIAGLNDDALPTLMQYNSKKKVLFSKDFVIGKQKGLAYYALI